jgi:hypothetical protein
MRKRAYRPEVSDCLEERTMQSGVAGLSAHPVVLSRRRFNKVGEHMGSSFMLFSMNRVSFGHLHEELRDFAVIIPFGRVDGLGTSINRILIKMRGDIAAEVPHAIRSANDEVLAATRAVVEARVRAGDVVIR